MKATKDNLKDAATKLQEKTPAPMNTMLEKQPRAEALQKRAERSKMVTKDVPPTTPGIKSCTTQQIVLTTNFSFIQQSMKKITELSNLQSSHG